MIASRIPRAVISSFRNGCEKKLHASFNCPAKATEAGAHSSNPVFKSRTFSSNCAPYNPLRPSRSHTSGTRPIHSRHSFTAQAEPVGRFQAAFQNARHDYPVFFPLIFVGAVGMLGFCGYLLYDQNSKELLDGADMEFFSPAVKKHLQTAIWYSEIKPDPVIMVDAFTKALAQIEREGTDPLHRLNLGITIRFAEALEKAGQARGAVSLLEQALKDISARIGDIERGRSTALNATTPQPSRSGLPHVQAESPASERKRLLSVLVGVHDKLSRLYSSDHIQDMNAARHYAHTAVAVLLKSMPNSKSVQFEENQAGLQPVQVAHIFNQAGTIDLLFGDYEKALEEFQAARVPLRQINKGNPSPEEVQVLTNMYRAVTRPYQEALKEVEAVFLTSQHKALHLDEPQKAQELAKLHAPWSNPKWREARKFGNEWAREAVACFSKLTSEQKDEVTINAVLEAAFYVVQEAGRAGPTEDALLFSKTMLAIVEDEGGPGWNGLRTDGWTESEIGRLMASKEQSRKQSLDLLEFFHNLAAGIKSDEELLDGRQIKN